MVSYEFYRCTFKNWSLYRGVALPERGIVGDPGKEYRISLPASERAPDYLVKLKTVTELIFDTFLTAYTVGIIGQQSYFRSEAANPHKSRRDWIPPQKVRTTLGFCTPESRRSTPNGQTGSCPPPCGSI